MNIKIIVKLMLLLLMITSMDSFEFPVLQGVTYAFYDITGRNEFEIRTNLNKFGPFDSDGKRYDALTNWHVFWNWEGYGTDKPKYSTIKVNLMAIIILPKLNPSEILSNDVKIKWEKYISALMAHEQKHLEIANKCLNEIKWKIKDLSNGNGDDEARKILLKYKDLEINMDISTKHGQNDGVKFP